MMTYLEVLKKVQKVYNSCETIDQLNVGMVYVRLLIERVSMDVAKSGGGSVKSWMKGTKCYSSLNYHCSFLYRHRKTELKRRKRVDILPELVFHHPV